ncbi:MAG: alcohol dehydrogenase catalytic domain-containing protein [Thermodesulfobacteriota bacterium]
MLQVSHCAVCRTDAKIWKYGHRDLVLPRIPGHEICGRISGGAKRFVVWPGTACGKCAQCVSGAENLCREMRIIGFHEDGGFAEFTAVPEKSLIAVPEDLPGYLACMTEPMACAVNGLEQVGAGEGDRVLIFGAGPVGLMLALAVRSMGGIPFIREVNPRRIEQVKRFLDRAEIRVAAEASELEFDRAVNAAPDAATVTRGFSRLKPGGVFCLFSGLIQDTPVPVSTVNRLHYRQLRLVGAYGCTRLQMVKALGILADHQDILALLIQDRISLDRVPAVLPKLLAGESLKYIIELDSTGPMTRNE